MNDLGDTLRAIVSAAVRDELAVQLAPIRAAVEALAGGAAVGPVGLEAAAPALGKSVATLRRLAAAGRLPGAFRVGRSWKLDLGRMRELSR